MRSGLAVAFIVAAFAAAGAAALAQNVITAPSNTSRSGVQTVITQTRDAQQRRTATTGPQQSHHQPAAKDSAPNSSDRQAK